MFQPGDFVVLRGQPARVESCAGHQVTVVTEDGGQVQVAEHKIQRQNAPPVTRSLPTKDDPFPLELAIKLRQALEQLVLDWNGHHISGALWKIKGWHDTEAERQERLFKFVGHTFGSDLAPSIEDAEAILVAVETGVKLDRFIPVVTGDSSLVCHMCPDGADFETDGKTIRPIKPCPFPEGLVTEFTLNVPSGRVIIDDDLRDLCRIGSDRDINGRWGTHLSILDYAANGMAVGFGIGNSCPTVTRQSEGKYAIGHRQGGRKVASICTDLWAYSIIDYDEAQCRAVYYGLDLAKMLKRWTRHVVAVPAGLYQFRHFHPLDRDADKVLFATFERIGDALEPEDWCAKDAAFIPHITQAVQVQCQQWPTLYGDESSPWVEACYRVFQSEFRGCVPSRDWHRNGHRNHYLSTDIEGKPIREIPHFRFQGTWSLDRTVLETVVSKKDALFGGDCPLNESYAIAAGRILESVISFGLPPELNTDKSSPDFDTYTIKAVRQTMRKAARLWRGLVARYPHVAVDMADFASWMEDKAAVTRWIKAIDLGPERFDRVAFEAERKVKQAASEAAHKAFLMRKVGAEVQHLPDGVVGLTVDDETCSEDQVCVEGPDGRFYAAISDLVFTPAMEERLKEQASDRLAAFRALLGL